MSDSQFESAFLSALAAIQKDYAEAEAFEQNWMPEDGTYEVLLSDLRTGTYTDKESGEEVFYIKPVYQITAGPLEGKTFQGDMCTNKSQTSLRALKTFIQSILGEEATNNLQNDVQAVAEQVGALIGEARIYTKVAKNGNTYRNCAFNGVTS